MLNVMYKWINYSNQYILCFASLQFEDTDPVQSFEYVWWQPAKGKKHSWAYWTPYLNLTMKNWVFKNKTFRFPQFFFQILM